MEGRVNGKPVTFILDTVGDYEIALPLPNESKVKQVSIEELVVRDLEVVSCRAAGVGQADKPHLGRRFLSRFAIILGQKGTLLHLEKPLKNKP